MKNNLKKFFYLLFPLFIGFISSIISGTGNGLYNNITHPPLSPPGYIFGIVWTILYILIGVSYFLLKENSFDYDISNIDFWYYLQLAINFIWPIFFFRLEAFTFSVFLLIFLFVTLIITWRKIERINRLSSYFLIPYIVWLIFALYLNIGVALLN